MTRNKTKYEILIEEISNKVDIVSASSKKNKTKSFNIYIAVTIVSALVTILVAISNDFSEKYSLIVKGITLFFSGATTVLTAWESFYNHKQLWVNYGETRNHLMLLELRLKFLNELERKDDSVLGEIYEEYKNILQNGSSKWKELRMDKFNKTN